MLSFEDEAWGVRKWFFAFGRGPWVVLSHAMALGDCVAGAVGKEDSRNG